MDVGILWQVEAGSDGAVLIGLGLGFVSIWVIGNLMRVVVRHWWPLIPGGIMALIGAVLLSGRVMDDVLRWWPLVLVTVGVLVVARALVSRSRGVP